MATLTPTPVLGALLLAGAVLPAAPAAADPPATRPAATQPVATQPAPRRIAHQRPDAVAVIDAFARQAAESTVWSARQKRQVAALLQDRAGDPAGAADALPAALIVLHPDLRQALQLLADERNDQALPLLTRLRQSDDPYLAAHAEFFEARTLALAERFEEALPLLDHVLGPARDKTLCSGEALFLAGVCQANMLQRREALDTLGQFAQLYPDAPERLLVGARHLSESLAAIEEGRLTDVQDRMGYARRRLDLSSTGPPTQQEQDRILAMLDKLIKEAEDKENSGGGGGGGGGGRGGGGAPSGNAPPGGPAQQSVAPVGEGRVGGLHGLGRSGDDNWNQLQERQRQEVLESLKTQFPDRYRTLIEQYYKSLQADPGR